MSFAVATANSGVVEAKSANDSGQETPIAVEQKIVSPESHPRSGYMSEIRRPIVDAKGEIVYGQSVLVL